MTNHETPPNMLTTDLQKMFYAWCERNGFGMDRIYSNRSQYRMSYMEAIEKNERFWSREQFRKAIKDNPSGPDLWRYQVGAKSAPLPYGDGGPFSMPYLAGANVAYVGLWTVLSIMVAIAGIMLLPFGGWVLLVGLFGLFFYRRWRVWKPMADTWNGRKE